MSELKGVGFEDHRGDVMSHLARMEYESALIQECRDWVNGRSTDSPTIEHVRILLVWLDSTNPVSFDVNKKEF